MDEAAWYRMVEEAVDSLPAELRAAMSNVEIVVEDEPPDGEPLLGLYQGIPLTQRRSWYAGALPDKITIFRGPLTRLYGQNFEQLHAQVRHVVLHERVRHVVLHEVAHHFGISDERLVEMDRY
jgi:predicted Zn-dependent protease with MMP-like domain